MGKANQNFVKPWCEAEQFCQVEQNAQKEKEEDLFGWALMENWSSLKLFEKVVVEENRNENNVNIFKIKEYSQTYQLISLFFQAVNKNNSIYENNWKSNIFGITQSHRLLSFIPQTYRLLLFSPRHIDYS